ncbi:MAG: CRTAC1 family protein [Thermoanaerobaculia bacterium]
MKARIQAMPPRLTALAALSLGFVACGPADPPPPDTRAPPTSAPASSMAIFEDAAAELGLEFSHRSGATGELYFPETVPPGAAFLDYDGDGDLDVYLVQGGSLDSGAAVAEAASADGAGDRLFRNDLAIPRWIDVTARAGIDAVGYGMGVAVADADGDGWLDLYVTNLGRNQLWLNGGDGSFREAAAAGVDDPCWSTSASFLDVDRDGRQDLFVACYKDWSLGDHRACRSTTGAADYCGPGSFLSIGDRLFHNRGGGPDGTVFFEDVSATSGILLEYGAGLGALTADFDGNGWTDIYVANDQDPNFLWLNRGDSTFIDRALIAGTAVNKDGLAEGSMGIVAGDVDGDGDPDLFMTHFRDETNTLYLNQGGGFFSDGTSLSRLGSPSRPYTGFGTAFLDYDNDGWLDVAVANGRVSVDEEQRSAGAALPLAESNQLFHNLGGRFEEVSERGGDFAAPAVGRGLAVGDVDHDGDPDLLVANAHGRTGLFLNRVGQDAGWLGVRPVTPALIPVVGVEIALERSDGTRLVRVSRTDGSYLSARDPRLLFGLGEAAATRLEATWPDGRRQRWELETMQRFPRRYLVLFAPTGAKKNP